MDNTLHFSPSVTFFSIIFLFSSEILPVDLLFVAGHTLQTWLEHEFILMALNKKKWGSVVDQND